MSPSHSTQVIRRARASKLREESRVSKAAWTGVTRGIVVRIVDWSADSSSDSMRASESAEERRRFKLDSLGGVSCTAGETGCGAGFKAGRLVVKTALGRGLLVLGLTTVFFTVSSLSSSLVGADSSTKKGRGTALRLIE